MLLGLATIACEDKPKGKVHAAARPSTPRVAAQNDGAFLQPLEREVLAELSLLRRDPPGYARFLTELRRHYRGTRIERPGETPIVTHEGVAAVDEAIAALKRTRPMGPLEPSWGLTLAAREHAADLGPNDKTGHAGLEGSTPQMRMERHGRWFGRSGEVIAFGPTKGRDIVVQLLVDDGVPDRGHRTLMLEPAFAVAGVGVGPHLRYRMMCVVDLAAEYVDVRQ